MAQLMLVNPKARKRRRKTAKRKTVRRRNPAPVISANPRKRKRRVARKTVRSRRRRNPSARGGIMKQAMGATIAAGGALALDAIWGYAPIPVNLKTGPLKHVVKAAGAIGLGMLAGMVVKKDTANQMATGALTVVMHGAMVDAVNRFAPNVKLGGDDDMIDLGYWASGYPVGAGESVEGIGEFMPSDYSNEGNYVQGMGMYMDEGY